MQNEFLMNSGKFFEKSDIQHKFMDSTMQPKSVKKFFDAESCFLINNVPENSILLDAGCGWGRHLSLISKKLSEGVGIDTDKKRIKESKIYLKGKKNIRTFLANIYSIPFSECCFDIVICMNNTFGNLYNHKLALKEMLRVLKDDGTLLISVHSDKMSEEKIDWYKKIGLKNPRLNRNIVITDDGFYSYCFSKDYLKNLFSTFKIKYKIHALTSKSYLCELQKNQK
jgi:ubiquinone/menaquinone biosynthesis C-methylase UbiE